MGSCEESFRGRLLPGILPGLACDFEGFLPHAAAIVHCQSGVGIVELVRAPESVAAVTLFGGGP